MLVVCIHVRLRVADRVVGSEIVLGDRPGVIVGGPLIVGASIPRPALGLEVRLSLWRARRA